MGEPQGHPLPKDWRAHKIRVIEAILDPDQVTDKDYVDAAIASAMTGLHWQEAVLDRYDPTGGLPADVAGNRYISTATANGWTVDYIYEGTGGSGFVETIPTEGYCLTVEDEDAVYYYNDAANWVKFGNIIDHANLSNVTSDQHHAQLHQASHQLSGADEIATIKGLTGLTITEQSSGYYVSDAIGNDGFDGGEFSPFKTPTAALGASLTAGNWAHRLFIDNRAFGNYTLDLAGASNHFITVEGYMGFGSITITQANGTFLFVKNMSVTIHEGAAQSSNSDVTIVHGALNDVLGLGGAGNPTQTNVKMIGPTVSTVGSLFGHLAAANTVKGWSFEDSPTGGRHDWQDLDMRSYNILNLLDGVNPQDGAAFGQIGSAITTHAALPDAHHTEDHAPRHKDGGADELDVSELAGALGGAGEIPETDGAAVTWVDPDGRYDPKAHKDSHDPEDGSDPLDTAAPGSIDETANAEGTAHEFARADHNHQHLAALHENGGGAEINVGGLSGLLADDQHIIDAEAVSAMGAKADANPLNHDKGISVGTGFPGAPSDGDLFNRTDLDMVFRYDGTRAKWLSEHSEPFSCGRGVVSDIIDAYCGVANAPMSATSGFRMPRNGTIIAVTAENQSTVTRTIDYRVNNSAVNRVQLALTAAKGGKVVNANQDFSADDILQVLALIAAGNSMSNLIATLEVKWRA